jgi:hypothetical protein
MIFQKSDPREPKFPFILMNRYYIHNPMRLGMLYVISEKEFRDKRLIENTVVIDVQCRRFDVLDIVRIGRNFNPLHYSCKHRMIRVKYVYSEPVQLSFDEARQEYMELVCSRRWYRETHESEAQFRARNAEYADMGELLKSIGYLGNWLI